MHNINAYRIGDDLRINLDLDLELAEPLSLAGAHKSSEELEQASRQGFSSRVTIAVHLEPRSDKPESNEGSSPPLGMLARHFQNYLKRKIRYSGPFNDRSGIGSHS
jgi:hypothetical protein